MYQKTGPEYEVDPETGCWNWLLGKCGKGYGWRKFDGKMRAAHRVYFERHHGYLPPYLDHICRNRGCVNPEHLRPIPLRKNAQNRDPAGVKGSTSRYRNVSWCKEDRVWRVAVTLDGKRHNLGCFRDEDVAGRVAAEWRRDHMPYSSEALTG